MTAGLDKQLYVFPFDDRASFQSKMFGWEGTLSAEQTAEIASAKGVIYDGFRAAVADRVPKDKAAILVDEHFGAAVLNWRAGKISRKTAAGEIARRYAAFTATFEKARAAGRAHAS